jgi:catechol 2,3-dioxygenase-like lactoylglutathione lyase family enzyme
MGRILVTSAAGSSSLVTMLRIDHVQVAAPPGCESAAREFYGGLLGLEELPKPDALRARGGVWFRVGEQELHIGVEVPFVPAEKAHPGLVAADLEAVRAGLRRANVDYVDDDKIVGVDRLFVSDPFGNRLEIRCSR